MSLNSLQDVFVHELKDIYDAEKRLVKALPKMAKAAGSDKLRKALKDHLAQTEEHVSRLEEVFELLDKPARGKKCAAMEGLIEEGSDILEEEGDEAARDAAMICAAQKVEHYEIATYGTLVTYANTLGLNQAAELLSNTLAEEKEADELLSQIATEVNSLASAHAE